MPKRLAFNRSGENRRAGFKRIGENRRPKAGGTLAMAIMVERILRRHLMVI
jgi:hypothetical protein